MFFKLTVFCSLIFLISCSNNYNFKEDRPVISLNYDSNCLSDIGNAIELYSNEVLSDREIQRNFNCVIDAIDYIQLRVKGENKGVYNTLEIKFFLDKFLFNKNEKTIGFYESLLALKGQIFGGDTKNLTFTGLKVLKIFLLEAKDLALIMKPHVSELLFKKPFDEAVDIKTILKPASKFLQKWALFQDKDLNIQIALNFFKNADIKIKAQESWVSIFNLLRSVDSKNIEIKHEEKLNALRVFQNYYTQTLDLKKGLASNWEFERESFFNFSLKVESLFLSILESINLHPNAKWSLKDLTHITNLVSEYGLLGKSLSLSAQEHVLKVIFGKYFPNENEEIALNSKNFKKIIYTWSSIKTFLDATKNIEGYVGESFPYVKEGTDIFSQFTQRRWPSLTRVNRTILIPDYSPIVEFSFQSLFHSSWQFSVAELLIKTYSKDLQEEGSSQGLDVDQIKEAYLDVFLFLKELDLLDEKSRGSWFRVYNEGNLFVPSAIADDKVSLSEIADYIAYTFSAYHVGGYIKEYMETRCPTFDEACSFNYVLTKGSEVFESLPGLGQYLRFEDSNNLKESYNMWQENLEYIAKLTNDESPYKRSQWFRASIANQYIEVIFRKYDLNGSDTLNFEEVSLSYADFKEVLKLLPMVKGTPIENDDKKLKGILTFFVKNGKVPEFKNGQPSSELILHILLCGGSYTSKRKECTFESDRSKLMSLLAFITKISSEF